MTTKLSLCFKVVMWLWVWCMACKHQYVPGVALCMSDKDVQEYSLRWTWQAYGAWLSMVLSSLYSSYNMQQVSGPWGLRKKEHVSRCCVMSHKHTLYVCVPLRTFVRTIATSAVYVILYSQERYALENTLHPASQGDRHAWRLHTPCTTPCSRDRFIRNDLLLLQL